MSEYDERLDGLRAVMADAGVDLAAIGPTANMRYLTGHVSHPDERVCLLLVSAETAGLVVPKLNAEEWAAYTRLPLYTWEDAEGPGRALGAALKDRLPVRKLAADGAMRADFLLSLLAAADPVEIMVAEQLMVRLRICKSAQEIAGMERAAAQADRAMRAALEACRTGVTEAQVAWAAEAAFRLDGAEEVCFSMVGAGPNGAYPHHTTGSHVLQTGEAVVIDIGASLAGYKSDITRIAFLGEPPPHFLKAYEAVLRANEQGRAAVKPGVAAHTVDQAARRSLEEAGYGQYFIHRTGHGLGLEGHEPPYIMAGNQQVLAEDMVFSIEPGVYLPGQFGIRIEDIVVVTSDGMRTLTGFQHELAMIMA
jgi:Xaa-Pro aminopeptidase